jgi:tellurite methyltransferase
VAESDAREEPDWQAYYAVTAERPAWRTVVAAAETFEQADAGARPDPSRFAVDLGCGAGRDSRELLRRGWRVLAIDREAAAIEALRAATPPADQPRLETLVADLAVVDIPPADLINASISLPFLPEPDFWATLSRALAAVRPGGRFATMLFGDHDDSASEAGMTCPSPDAIRAAFAGFVVEEFIDREEDGRTALGEPHHWHDIQVIARRDA